MHRNYYYKRLLEEQRVQMINELSAEDKRELKKTAVQSAFRVAGILALIIGTQTYRKLKAKKNKYYAKCKSEDAKLKGKAQWKHRRSGAYALCVLNADIMHYQDMIKALKSGASKCSQSKNPTECKAKVQQKIASLQRKIAKKQNRIKKIKQSKVSYYWQIRPPFSEL